MRQIKLHEYERSQPIALSEEELKTLLSLRTRERDIQGRLLAIEPVERVTGSYTLRPDSTVGALEVGDISLLINPKVGIPQLLSLACYAMGLFRQQDKRLFDFEQHQALPDTLALALNSAANRAFARGLLHGYRSEEDSLYTVRGRIRFDDQLRRRFDIPLPIEVRYDEFTEDILPNQLVKAATHRLGAMHLRSAEARRRLGRIAGLLDNVSLVDFSANDVPDVTFDRLNEHYRDVVGLSRLILRHSAFESSRGAVRANGFLIDMNQLFQQFVTQALREALNVSEPVLRENSIASLDEGRRVNLRPDLVWQAGGTIRFVGDVKYKNLVSNRNEPPNADLYQLLAYTMAANLPGGTLIYAKGEAEPVEYKVRHAGKTLEVAALDLELPLENILEQVKGLAGRMRRQVVGVGIAA